MLIRPQAVEKRHILVRSNKHLVHFFCEGKRYYHVCAYVCTLG